MFCFYGKQIDFVKFQVLAAANMKMSSGMLRRVVSLKLSNVSEERTASISRRCERAGEETEGERTWS
jgi:hypothetical protein